jgi:hypothetical protein
MASSLIHVTPFVEDKNHSGKVIYCWKNPFKMQDITIIIISVCIWPNMYVRKMLPSLQNK